MLQFVIASLIALGGLVSNVNAQWIESQDIPSPLVESEPFDLLFLQTEGVILKIVPLREPPENPLPQSGNLVFEYFAESEGLLTVPFSEVSDYKTFKQQLVEEAEAWMSEDKYGLAFRNLLWVYDHGGKFGSQSCQAAANLLVSGRCQRVQEEELRTGTCRFLKTSISEIRASSLRGSVRN